LSMDELLALGAAALAVFFVISFLLTRGMTRGPFVSGTSG